MQMYNDRPPVVYVARAEVETQDMENAEENSSKIPKPEISIIVEGAKIFKPGMKSVFIEDENEVTIKQEKNTLKGSSYCSCNSVQVCTCNTVCICEGVCSCHPYCSCQSHCGSYNPCSCQSRSSGGCTCQSVSCYGPCACVPVH